MNKELVSELQQYRKELHKLTRYDDYEEAHIDADRILVEVLELLAKEECGPIAKEISSIINEYCDVGKWYA